MSRAGASFRLEVDRVGHRDVPLEALRGLAAFCVVLWHVVAAFFPTHFPPVSGRRWIPAFSGGAAVNFFFVLSGFVLTRGAMARASQVDLARSCLKRWPRLAGPILLTVLCSWIIARAGGYVYGPAALQTHSDWLAKFGNAGHGPADRSLLDAVLTGGYLTLFRGDFAYDSSLWTMAIEFRGSFLALAMAAGVLALRPAGRRVVWAFCCIVVLLIWNLDALYLTFVAGVCLAAVVAPVRVPTVLALALIATSFALEGYGSDNEYPGGIFGQARLLSPTMIHILGALMLLLAVEGADSVRRGLSGGWAVWLGRLSFPVYLLHVVVICSLGSAACVWAQGWLGRPWPAVIGGAVSVAGSVAAAWPLAVFDRWWVARVNGVARRWVPGIGA